MRINTSFHFLEPSFITNIRERKRVIASDPILSQIANEKLTWQKVKAGLTAKPQLQKALDATVGGQGWPLSLIVDGLSSIEFHGLRSSLRMHLKKASPEQAAVLFDELVNRSLQTNSTQALERCLSLVSLRELECILHKEISASKTSPQATLDALAIAGKEYQKLMTSSEDTLLKQHGNSFIKTVRNVIDSILTTFHITDASRDSATSYEATEKLNAYVKLIGFPLVIFSALAAITSAFTAFVVTASILAALALGIMVYVKWLQDSPDTIERCHNLVEQARQGELSPVLAREAEIDRVLQCLASSTSGHRTHPLLVGPSGVGKTEIVRGIAQRIALGRVPDKLKGKKLLALNTANLFDRGGGGPRSGGEDPLQRILNRMGKKKDHYIVFLDEIHTAMHNKLEVGEKLKTVLDTNPEGFHLCIGATTKDEYEKYIATDIAFCRRFEIVDIHPTTKEQTMMILREILNREAPELDIDEKKLESIYESSSKTYPKLNQPASSIQLLAKVMDSSRQMSTLAEAIQKLQQELSNLSSLLYSMPEGEAKASAIENIEKLEKKLKMLRVEQAWAKEKESALNRMIRFRRDQVSALFKTALFAKNKQEDRLFMKFLFWNYYLIPSVKNKLIQHQATSPVA